MYVCYSGTPFVWSPTSPPTPLPPPPKPKDGLANIQYQGGGEGSEANGNLHCDPVSKHPGYCYPPYVSDHIGWSSCT